MLSERTMYEGEFIRQTENARLFVSGTGCVKFSVEGWKEREIEAAGFSEA